MLSVANDTRADNLSVLDEEAKSNLFGRKHSMPVPKTERSSMLRNKASVKDYFSTDQRFKEVFMSTGQKYHRAECSKHNNPRFIEIIAKLRDRSLNAEYMQKATLVK